MSNLELSMSHVRQAKGHRVGTSQFGTRKQVKLQRPVLPDAIRDVDRRPAETEAFGNEERAHIAREIHDELGSCLTVIRLYLNGLKSKVCETQLDLGTSLEELTDMVSGALKTVSRITTTLRPLEIDHKHLWPAINWLTADIQRIAHIRCAVVASAAAKRHVLSTPQSTAMFRVVQEALSNIMKHAGASALEVKAEISASAYSLVISDNGKGISIAALNKPGAWGIAGMRERIMAIEGVLEIGPRQGGGTELRITLPLGR